jgi:hypothetical protein
MSRSKISCDLLAAVLLAPTPPALLDAIHQPTA